MQQDLLRIETISLIDTFNFKKDYNGRYRSFKSPCFTKFVKSEFARKKKQKQGDLVKITSNKVGINSGQGTKLCRKRMG